MLASPEASRFVLASHAHLFKPTYPKSKEKMIGPSALFFHQGEYHTHLRKLVQSTLSPEAIRKLIPDIEAIAISALESWASDQVINTYHEMKKVSGCLFFLSLYILISFTFSCFQICFSKTYELNNHSQFAFEVGVLLVFGHLNEKYREELKENYCIVDKGYNSFPSNLPGTAYNKAIVVRAGS